MSDKNKNDESLEGSFIEIDDLSDDEIWLDEADEEQDSNIAGESTLDDGVFRFTPEADECWNRLDATLSKRLAPNISREKIKKAIQDGKATINGKVCTSPKEALQPNTTIEFTMPILLPKAKPESFELDIVHQDEDILVINKPHGLTVHPCPSCPDGTLVNKLLSNFPNIAAMGGDRPGIVHRLDKGTSGLIMVALNERVRLALADDFADRQIKKEYLALVHGVPRWANGRMDQPIARDSKNKTKMCVDLRSGRPALSEYRTLYKDPMKRYSLLAVRIYTGRTHQIRVHLKHLGHPIIGDKTYFDQNAVSLGQSASIWSNPTERQVILDYLDSVSRRPLLHAWKLGFTHPKSGEEINICCPPPDDFFTAALRLGRSQQKVILTGNPGCGKSTILNSLGEHNIPIWNADECVKKLYEVGADGWSMIKSRFGDRFCVQQEDDEQGPLDKRALFSAMYNDEYLRHDVEALIHPLAMESMLQFFNNNELLFELGATEANFAVAEVPLWFESLSRLLKTRETPTFNSSSAVVIGLNAPFSVREERLHKTRNWPLDMIAKMESWQWDEAKKMDACHFVIDNSKEDCTRGLDDAMDYLKNLREEELNQLKSTLIDLTSNCDELD